MGVVLQDPTSGRMTVDSTHPGCMRRVSPMIRFTNLNLPCRNGRIGRCHRDGRSIYGSSERGSLPATARHLWCDYDRPFDGLHRFDGHHSRDPCAARRSPHRYRLGGLDGGRLSARPAPDSAVGREDERRMGTASSLCQLTCSVYALIMFLRSGAQRPFPCRSPRATGPRRRVLHAFAHRHRLRSLPA